MTTAKEARERQRSRKEVERLARQQNFGSKSDMCMGLWTIFARRNRLDVRQTWLHYAGWDPAGWTFLAWRALPKQLQVDLENCYGVFKSNALDKDLEMQD